MSAKKENEVAVSIPLDDIEKIEIYLNKPNHRTRKRKSLSAIISATGADYAINGTLYNMRNGNPVCPLRRNGVTLYHGKDLYRGYLWDNYNANSFHFDLVPNEAWENFIACSHILMDGKAIKKPIYNVAQGGEERLSVQSTSTGRSGYACMRQRTDHEHGKRRNSLQSCLKATDGKMPLCLTAVAVLRYTLTTSGGRYVQAATWHTSF